MKKSGKLIKIAVPIFLIFAAVMGAVLFLAPFGVPAVNEGTGGYGPFDLRFSYTPDNIMTVLSHFSGSRKDAYTSYFILDFVFSFFCFWPMIGLPILIYRQNDKHYILFRATVFSAVFYTVFNFVENILLIRIVHSSPVFTDSDANLASGCTTLKWIFLAICALSLVLLAVCTLYTIKRETR